MNEHEAKVMVLKNGLASYFDTLVNDGLLKPQTMHDWDYDYLANFLLKEIQQVELTREYAV